jgi:hypothetical protein
MAARCRMPSDHPDGTPVAKAVANIPRTMTIYLDMRALRRPFDDQAQPRMWLEALAVSRILASCGSGVTIDNSGALETENAMYPKPVRRTRVSGLLGWFGEPAPLSQAVLEKAIVIRGFGFGDMDALHLAFAEATSCQYFLSCDDELLTRSRRHGRELRTIALNPVDFVRERVVP